MLKTTLGRCPSLLITKLSEYEIHPNILNWLYSFLTNRTQRVITTSNPSASITTSTGSPQGCVLSPLLFSFYVASMPTLNPNIQILKYADDTVILEFLSKAQPSNLQQEVINLCTWCSDRDLLLNSKKTKEMVFSNARDNPTTQHLVINGSQIEQVTEFVYLGTALTTKLDFTATTNAIVKKARKRLHIMSKLYHLGIDTKLITTCYKCFIESVILYHLVVIYSHLSADSKKALQHVIRSAGRLAGGLTFTAVADLYTQKN